MTPQIKQRIEQIRRGEVPEGYKKTKVGIVPEEWDYEKLEKYLIQYHEISKYNNQYPVLTSSRKGIYLQADYYNREVASEDNTGYNVVPRGYFTYRHMSDDEIFKFNINTIVDKGIVSTLYPVFTAKNINNYFLRVLLNEGREFRRYAILQKQGGSRTYMYFDKLKQLKVCLPPLPEQEKIAEILQTQDKVIELQQKKIDELKRLKKVYLSKMFPQKGCNVPEIRFPGFTAPWEQRKVSDMFRVTRGYVLAATLTEEDQTNEMPYPVYSSQTKDNGLLGYYKDFLYEDAITWTTDGANAGTVNYRAGKFYCTNVCGVLLSNEVKASKMIAEALNNVAKSYVSYVGNPKLMNNVMADIEIMIPVSPLEQEKISKLFAVLDNLITLHQRKCDEEKQKKKALMQLLLTGIVRVRYDT